MTFLQDFSEIMKEKLNAAGYGGSISPNDSPHQIIINFWNICNRLIRKKPRCILKADYTVPNDCISAEKSILEKVRLGESLRPHMSVTLEKLSFNDDMLSDFGVHHFHLSLCDHKKNKKYLGRTSALLFAIVTDEKFYSIGIYDHKSWSKKCILEKINANWPELLEPYKSSETKTLSFDVNDKQRALLRRLGVNLFTTLSDGSILGSPGGGKTMSSVSSSVRNSVSKIEEKAKCLEKNYSRYGGKLIEKEKNFM